VQLKDSTFIKGQSDNSFHKGIFAHDSLKWKNAAIYFGVHFRTYSLTVYSLEIYNTLKIFRSCLFGPKCRFFVEELYKQYKQQNPDENNRLLAYPISNEFQKGFKPTDSTPIDV